MRKWIAAAVAAASLCFSSLAPAQITTQRYAVTEYDGWTFAPIVTDDEIAGFFCYADPETLTGDNIPLILYHRELDGSFTTWGWSNYDLGSAVMYIREVYDNDKIFEIDPKLSRAVGEGSDISEPKNMTEGLYLDDPARLLLEMAADPEVLMNTLVAIGWKAAPKLSSLAVAEPMPICPDVPKDPVDALLTEIKVTLESAIFGAPAAPVDCFPNSGCTGCVTNYNAPVPDPNGSWIYNSTGTPSYTTDKLCFYDFPATQYWWKSGKDVWCNACTGSGTDNVFIRGMKIVPQGTPCSPPAHTPR